MKILATIKDDLGKKISLGGGSHDVVAHQQCEDCDNSAVIVIEGEVDSFGREISYLCQSCASKCKSTHEQWIDALDVKDRESKEDYLFVVNEETNCDACKDWFHKTKILRSATSFYRKIEEQAASLGGLYPDNRIQELPIVEANEQHARYKIRQDALQKEMDEY